MYYISYPYYHPQWLALNTTIPVNPNSAVKPQSPFPPINTTILNSSAQQFQELMKQANLLLDKIINSKEFAHELMDSAQLSNTKKVDELILSTGITLHVKTDFTPTGIRIKIDNFNQENSCCDLTIELHW
ncbi:hypothetical protein [Sporosarcina sp. G11-34]|uniref:hypothetical protein n=1 Tax=Sporosarcina sp. G11-34 TaxID=2849605 RepID=UPI0022A9820D|nr:hypothetical protein [Sporosarcina sp. G11-34]MCZ2258135.1 hypothetical protein [Sporosarcina sp. G11-34]